MPERVRATRMKACEIAVAIMLVVLSAGCPTVQSIQPNQIIVEGAYTHSGSKMVFPVYAGLLQRVRITQYAPAEQDVGVGYNLADAGAPVAATVYVYPAPRLTAIGSSPAMVEEARTRLFREHWEGTKSGILRVHPDATTVSDEEFVLTTAGQARMGRKATFALAYTFGEHRQDSLSELYLFQKGPWLIKYRITFPKTIQDEVRPVITDFFKALAWPQD